MFRKRSLLQKIKDKASAVFHSGLLHLGFKLKSPFLTVVGLWRISGKINNSGQFTVLCLGRSIFLDDLKAMATWGRALKYVVIHMRYFKRIFAHLVKPAKVENLTESNYHTHKKSETARKRYYTYLKALIPLLQKFLGFQAVLSGNVAYIVQQEIARVCEENRIPFIVLHKEGLDAFGHVHVYQGQRFIGARMLFGNERMRNALLTLRMPGLTQNNSRVVGVPRFDFYINQREETPKAQIAFFSFYPQDRFIALIKDERTLERAKTEYANFHKLIMDFALRHPDLTVTIKTKSAEYFIQYAQDILKANFKEGIPNLVITNSVSPFELIKNSRAVISFNSTTLIEGLLAEKLVISPDFRSFISDTSWNFFESYSDLVHYVKNGLELEECLLNPGKYSQVDPQRREKFLKEVMFSSDGKASFRAESEIVEAIKEYQTEGL